MNKTTFILSFILVLFTNPYAHAEEDADSYLPVYHAPESFTEEMHISRGGQLYDNWWGTTTDNHKPSGNHSLWRTQNTNKRSGYSTYRCKECHGWDYLGKDGAYGKGSHYTGFVGVYNASRKMTAKELEAVLMGSTNRDHDFSMYLKDEDISNLVLFMKMGIVESSIYIKADGSSNGGNVNMGQEVYSKTCMTECHGPQGMAINFGDDKKPDFIGNIARKNPWEFIHKVRSGQPGTRMSSGIIFKMTDKELRDLLAYSQTLPEKRPELGWFDKLKIKMGLVKKTLESPVLKEHRGFGPKLEQGL